MMFNYNYNCMLSKHHYNYLDKCIIVIQYVNLVLVLWYVTCQLVSYIMEVLQRFYSIITDGISIIDLLHSFCYNVILIKVVRLYTTAQNSKV